MAGLPSGDVMRPTYDGPQEPPAWGTGTLVPAEAAPDRKIELLPPLATSSSSMLNSLISSRFNLLIMSISLDCLAGIIPAPVLTGVCEGPMPHSEERH